MGGRMSPPAGARQPVKKKRRSVNRKCRPTDRPIWLPYCRPPTSAISAIKQSLPGQSLRRRGTFGFWPHCLIGIFGTRRIIAIALNQLNDLAAYLCLSKTLRWIGGKLGKSNSCLMGSEVPRVPPHSPSQEGFKISLTLKNTRSLSSRDNGNGNANLAVLIVFSISPTSSTTFQVAPSS